MNNTLNYIADLLSKYDWVGWIIAILALFYSNRNNKKNNELLNQPNFMFCQFGNDRRVDTENNAQIRECGNKNCDKLHWFDIKNTGKFSAESVAVGIFSSNTDNIHNPEHWLYRGHLQSGDTMQVSYSKKVSNAVIHPGNTCIMLLEYRSPYSKYKYKRVYTLSISQSLVDSKGAPSYSIYYIDEYYKNDSHLCIKRIATRLIVLVKKAAYHLSNKPYDVCLWAKDL